MTEPTWPDGEPMHELDQIDPVLDSDAFYSRVAAGENAALAAVQAARELGDPRAEEWAREIDDARSAAKDGELP